MKGWNFCSDNVAGAAPEILQALINAGAAGAMMPYGADPLTSKVEKRLAEIFEIDLAVHFVATGTAANSLSLAAMCPPYGAVYCHRDSHVNVDECGAPEFFTGGAKLMALNGPNGKLDAAGLAPGIVRQLPAEEDQTLVVISQSLPAGSPAARNVVVDFQLGPQ